MEKRIYDAIVVGAGISGIVLARKLKGLGQKILVMEKSKGLGGRIATRRDGEAIYDHGAQFYKVYKNKSFELDDLWSSKGQVFPWFESKEHHFKCSAGGLTQIVKAIADKSEIVFEKKVHLLEDCIDLASAQVKLKVHTEAGEFYFAKSVYLTAPLPQSIDILERSGVNFSTELRQIEYAKALVGLMEVQSTLAQVKEIKYFENVGTEIFSISNQLSKNVSPKLVFTVVMQPDWSEKFFDDAESQTIQKIVQSFEQYLKELDPAARVTRSQLKKWRYSHPQSIHSQKFEVAGQNSNIFILGDAFGGGSIRGAIDSAESITPLPCQ